jgi:alkylated DNA repair protein alkB family protein 7
MALWKLDRVDSTRRRRRNKGLKEETEAGEAGLQSLFHGEYGFEEVSPLLCPVGFADR